VFPGLPLIPTGGVNLDNLRAHLDAGAHSVGVGSALSKGADRAAIEASARRYLDAAHPRPDSQSEETP
jgi:2-dehydro-3-deoxyphosphogluconate aldolase/(4S)-4-hydroxy-2-oxoglutarate aldolase